MQSAHHVRLYADEHGESHFADVDLQLASVYPAPPAPPLNIVELFPATHCSFVGASPGWAGDIPHPAPNRELLCNLQGDYEVTASDGEKQRLKLPICNLVAGRQR